MKTKELPTLKLRSKILYNEIKRIILKEEHDVAKIQSTEFINAIGLLDLKEKDTKKYDIKLDKRTINNWWDGLAVPNATHLKLFEKVCLYNKVEGVLITNWIYPTHNSLAVQRHLYALDARLIENTDRSNKEENADDWIKQKKERAENSIKAVNDVWSFLTSNFYNNESILGLSKQAEMADIDIQSEYSNKVLSGGIGEFSSKNPSSIIYVLMEYAFLSKLEDKEMCMLWAMDMATLAASFSALQYVDFDHDSEQHHGQKMMCLRAFAESLFWDNSLIPDSRLEMLTPRHSAVSIKEGMRIFSNARDSYYEQFRVLGISEKEVMNLISLFAHIDYGENLGQIWDITNMNRGELMLFDVIECYFKTKS